MCGSRLREQPCGYGASRLGWHRNGVSVSGPICSYGPMSSYGIDARTSHVQDLVTGLTQISQLAIGDGTQWPSEHIEPLTREPFD